MVFKKMLRAFGVGGPSVDTVLATPGVAPGQAVTGRVDIRGGDHDVSIEHVALGLVTRVEVEGGEHDHDATVEFHRVVVAGGFHLPAGASHTVPFSMPVPWETPVTSVFGQHLHGMTMGVRTELAVARAVDKGDLDPLQVHALPAQAAVLDAVARLGFRFKGADLERGHLRGARQTLPFYQEIEFHAGPAHAHAMSELELTFVAGPHTVDVILEIDKRGGIFTGGHDVYHHFQVPTVGGERTDWAAAIDGWLRQAVTARPTHGHGGHGHGGHGHGGHGHGGHGHGGFGHGGFGHGGAGAAIAGVGAGLIGGLVAGELLEEIFDDAGEE